MTDKKVVTKASRGNEKVEGAKVLRKTVQTAVRNVYRKKRQ